MAPVNYSGPLSAKRKSDLVDIAQALHIYDETKSTVPELKEVINAHLDANESDLVNSSQFKGLYANRRRHHSEEDTTTELKAAVGSVVKQSRKSMNKLLEKTIDAANIPLPDSPLVNRVAEVANESLQVALAPTEHIPKDLQVRLRDSSSAVVTYTMKGQQRVERLVRIAQKYLSRPEQLITTAIAVELLFLLSQVLQFYEHTLFFPPVGGSKGDFYSLLHSVFGWAPVSTLTIKFPEIISLFSGDVWSALSWWFFATILPPYALSTLINFGGNQRSAHRGGVTTRQQSNSQLPHPTPDALAFTLFRFAALLLPLTTAAPSSFVDALEVSGNAQGRALGAGLVAALTAADRLRG